MVIVGVVVDGSTIVAVVVRIAVDCGHRIVRIEHGGIIICIIIAVNLVLLKDIAISIVRDAITWKRRIIVSSYDATGCCLLLKHLVIFITIEDIVVLHGIITDVAICLIGITLERVILGCRENTAALIHLQREGVQVSIQIFRVNGI